VLFIRPTRGRVIFKIVYLAVSYLHFTDHA
jgi:hypothetical protein